jgi:hypothetical protein
LQKAQERVHLSPPIIKVAAFWLQHSPMLGQRASSQTVVIESPRSSSPVSTVWRALPVLAFIHSGTRGCPLSIGKSWISDIQRD